MLNTAIAAQLLTTLNASAAKVAGTPAELALRARALQVANALGHESFTAASPVAQSQHRTRQSAVDARKAEIRERVRQDLDWAFLPQADMDELHARVAATEKLSTLQAWEALAEDLVWDIRDRQATQWCTLTPMLTDPFGGAVEGWSQDLGIDLTRRVSA